MAYSSQLYRLAADGLVIVHLLFILFVVGGGLLVLRNRLWAFVHLPAALWGALVELAGWFCPLTPLENRLRQLGGEAGYSTGFVERYLLPLIYPASLNRQMQVGLGIAVIVLNLLIYFRVYRHLRSAYRLQERRVPPSPAKDNSGPDSL